METEFRIGKSCDLLLISSPGGSPQAVTSMAPTLTGSWELVSSNTTVTVTPLSFTGMVTEPSSLGVRVMGSD